MAFRFQYLPDALVRLGIDHRDTTIVVAESYKDHFGDRVVTHVVGIASEIDRLSQRVGRAVKHAHFPVSGVGDIQFVELGQIQGPLRLAQVLDAVNHSSCESIDHFERVVAQSRNEKPFALHVSGKVVQTSGHTRHRDLFLQLQRKSLPGRSLSERRFLAAVCQNRDHDEHQSSHHLQLLHRSPLSFLHFASSIPATRTPIERSC